MNAGVLLQWFGHACFTVKLLTVNYTLAFDPFPADKVGYKPINIKADVVLISHHHFDHDFVDAVQGKYQMIDKPIDVKVRNVRIIGHKTSHGNGRGDNTLFVVEAEGLRISHCGDLGVLPTPQQLKKFGRIDVLLVPVGGYYTIDAKQAWQLVKMIKPKVVIPMHYGHPKCEIKDLAPVDEFLKGKKKFKKLKGNSVTITKDKLPKETEIWILQTL